MSALPRPGSDQLEIALDGDEDAVRRAALRLGMDRRAARRRPDRRARNALLRAARRTAPDEALGRIAPRGAPLSVRQLAANAVMAGCLPSYMPMLEAAVAAMQVDAFNLFGMQMTTHPCALLVIVHGPRRPSGRHELGRRLPSGRAIAPTALSAARCAW